MKSIHVKKSVLNLTLCLLIAVAAASCSSTTTNSRNVAQVPSLDQRDDVSKIEDGVYPPHRFHAKRFEQYNERY